MGTEREVFVLTGVRTAVGKYGGSLKDMPPTALGEAVVRESIKRSGVSLEEVDQVVFGNVIHTEAKDMYLARVAAVRAGIPVSTPALTLNRLCGSGLQAIISAAQVIRLGEATVAVAGGAENMSRAPYWITTLRWGQRMGDGNTVDAMAGALTDPFDTCHMGITAENIARKWEISREQQDALAVESHQRALDAIGKSKFKDQIVPIETGTKGKSRLFEVDESPRLEATLENLAKLNPAFDKAGTVTAGNASSINDGAAAVVLMEKSAAEERNLKPLGRLVGAVVVGVEPKHMGIGPVPGRYQITAEDRVETR